jgi:hypothetical protein
MSDPPHVKYLWPGESDGAEADILKEHEALHYVMRYQYKAGNSNQ